MRELFFSKEFFEQTSNSVILLDRQKIVQKANPSFSRITGYDDHEIVGKKINLLRSGKHEKGFYDEMWKKVDSVGFWEGEVWIRRKNGELLLSRRTIFLIKDSDLSDCRYVLIGRDSRDENLIYDKREEFYYRDFITGLPHSYIFREMFTSLIKEAARKNEKLAIILLDFVSFKHINESFGYTIGDNFLNIASERLRQSVGEDALMTRMGGDVFAIVLKNIESEKYVINIVEKIMENFKEHPFIFSGQEIYLSTNVGISLYPTDGKNDQDLFKAADLARYRAKENGKGHYQFYLPSLNARVFERLVLETNLRKAIDDHNLILYYQPQIDIASGNVVGMEALIRWSHPELGIVPPAQFIPVAEETGLILPIGRWVIRESCRQWNEWKENGYKPIVISVNLSAKQLQSELVDVVKDSLDEYDVDPKFIELEITETAVMKNVEDAIEILKELENIGIKISIDDFGTGYSSLNYLAKLPLHALKIDRSFIQNVSVSEEDATIVSTVIAMAHKLHLEVIAEGVEKESDLQFLKEQHCEKYQGFYFSPPVPSNVAVKWLRKEKDA